MADKSNIEWTDATWNPIVGCDIVSTGCTNCYAMKMAARIERMHEGRTHYAGTTEPSKGGAIWTGKIAQAPERILTQPLRWKRGRKVFVNSMGDLFHEAIPDEWIDHVFAIMALSPQHTFQVLTKRAARMRAYLSAPQRFEAVLEARGHVVGAWDSTISYDWPMRHVWLGVSTERQKEAAERIPLLLQTPASVRFISAEPLIDRLSLRWAKWDEWKDAQGVRRRIVNHLDGARMLDWVIVGGESGRGARPAQLEWVAEIVAQCAEAGVPCFVKQLGAMPLADGYPCELRSSKGGDMEEWPLNLRVRQFPSAAKALAA